MSPFSRCLKLNEYQFLITVSEFLFCSAGLQNIMFSGIVCHVMLHMHIRYIYYMCSFWECRDSFMIFGISSSLLIGYLHRPCKQLTTGYNLHAANKQIVLSSKRGFLHTQHLCAVATPHVNNFMLFLYMCTYIYTYIYMFKK